MEGSRRLAHAVRAGLNGLPGNTNLSSYLRLMGLITDVKHETAQLDANRAALRKFGLSVGAVFLLLGWVAWRKQWAEPLLYGFAGAGGLLVLFGAIAPAKLRAVYLAWMTMSLAIGWCVSRVLLTILFYAAIVPVAIMGRIFRLPFTGLRSPRRSQTYWIQRPEREVRHHAQMY